VHEECGRLRAAPGLIVSAPAALGIGAGLLARRRERSQPRVLGVVEPLKLRRRARAGAGWLACGLGGGDEGAHDAMPGVA
jgi:hypothetical protein